MSRHASQGRIPDSRINFDGDQLVFAIMFPSLSMFNVVNYAAFVLLSDLLNTAAPLVDFLPFVFQRQ